MFSSEEDSSIENSCHSIKYSLNDENLLQKPLNFESFFLCPNTKTILEEANQKSRYKRNKIQSESTIISDTGYSQTDSLIQITKQKKYKKNVYVDNNICENSKNINFDNNSCKNSKNVLESCFKPKYFQKIQDNHLNNSEKNEHNIEVTRDHKFNNDDIIKIDNEQSNTLFSRIEKPIDGFEIKDENQEYYNDNLNKEENVNPMKKLNVFKKMDVKMCVSMFLLYAFLDTFIAVYYACTPLQIAFIIMSMGSLLFYKYT